MPKKFTQVKLDPTACRTQVDEFGALLKSRAALSEKNDVQPFFKKPHQLSAFIGSYVRDVGPADVFAFEYPIYGDFAVDLRIIWEFGQGRGHSRVPNAEVVVVPASEGDCAASLVCDGAVPVPLELVPPQLALLECRCPLQQHRLDKCSLHPSILSCRQSKSEQA